MIKVRIVHKGLMLVAIPLVFGTAFISLLLYGLSESNRLVERELLLKDATINYIIAYTSILTAKTSRACYGFSHDPFFKKSYFSSKSRASEANKHLTTLLKSDQWLQIPPLQSSDPQLSTPGPQDPKLSSNPFLLKLQRLADRETKAALNAMNLLQITLVGGMLAGALFTIVLSVLFCLNITNRLLIILNNTAHLAEGVSLSPPLKGNDEIAELDQFLFKSAAEIRELERFKKEMIGVVSHELKSPLSSVGCFLTSLSAGVFGELNPRAKDKVERTNNSVKRLMGLVKELLYLDRLGLAMSPEEITVAEIINASVDTVKELSQQLGIEIIVKSEGAKVSADRNRLVQVIVNLLSNAMKFSPPQGKVTIETRQGDGWFECRVSDQGRGIPETFRKQIFEPFKQIDTKDVATKKGTGLGLTISRSIVEQHGGTIGVDSVEGKGSTFWFKIPATAQRSHPSDQDSGRASEPSSLQPKPGQVARSNSGQFRRFSVLQQGLVIIAVPLIFQIVFVSVIGCLLCQVREQTRREDNSKEILNTLNRAVEMLVNSDTIIRNYSLTNKPAFKKSWEDRKNSEIRLLDLALKLSAGDPDKIEELNKARDVLYTGSALLESEASQNGANRALQKAIDAVGIARLSIAISENGSKTGANSLKEIMSSIPVDGGIGTLDMMTQLQTRLMSLTKAVKPVIEEMRIMDGIMAREKALGERYSAERSKMIRTLELTLSAGIVLNIGLSIFLAVTLLRSLTSRLQHVMENTARLVQRSTLDPPKGGRDEIAHLDQVLFETGNRLVELEAFKRELISVVSHELRTPLMSISSALELFGLGTLGELSEKGSNRLKFAQDEADRLIRLINDLLDIEKMEAGKFVLDRSEIKVKELIEISIAAVAQLAETKQIKLESSVVDATLSVDRDRLCQVLINLLSNAIKFSPETGTISITVTTSQLFMEFRVVDRGRGIPEDLIPKVFDRFVQVEDSDASVRGGSGLGLAIARAIVEQHGGTIGVESQLGQGSSFWFKLPVHDAHEATLSR
jgi:signal transduction histidine kinase